MHFKIINLSGYQTQGCKNVRQYSTTELHELTQGISLYRQMSHSWVYILQNVKQGLNKKSKCPCLQQKLVTVAKTWKREMPING